MLRTHQCVNSILHWILSPGSVGLAAGSSDCVGSPGGDSEVSSPSLGAGSPAALALPCLGTRGALGSGQKLPLLQRMPRDAEPHLQFQKQSFRVVSGWASGKNIQSH